jgi:hypothetical protein
VTSQVGTLLKTEKPISTARNLIPEVKKLSILENYVMA